MQQTTVMSDLGSKINKYSQYDSSGEAVNNQSQIYEEYEQAVARGFSGSFEKYCSVREYA